MKIGLGFLLLLVLITIQCTQDYISEAQIMDSQLKNTINSSGFNIDQFILPNESNLNDIPQDEKNVLTKEKVQLGKLLFYETGFATDALKSEAMGTYSCASCHIPEAGFRANVKQGIADGGTGYGVDGNGRVRSSLYTEEEIDVQSARPLSLINVAYVTNTFWNGEFGAYGVNEETEHLWNNSEALQRNFLGYEGIETVNFEGLITHRLDYDSLSIDSLGYKELFDSSFAEVPTSDRYSQFTASLALSAYIRTLLADKAPFQDWLKGDGDAMTAQMKEGAILFFGKAQCFRCHYEPNLGSSEFHNLGVKDMYQSASYNTSSSDRRNMGRGGFTEMYSDFNKFKVPGIYNVSDSPFYFHGGSISTLEELIEYKIEATSENPEIPDSLLSSKFNKLYLSEIEIENLLVFLKEGLRDPDLIRFKPDSILSGNCFPNADIRSKRDLGCN